jgi:Protein of unknown function (DUF1479)
MVSGRGRLPRNQRHAASVREAFLTGPSPADFPAEDYERSWPDRFGPDQLNDIGRRGLALDRPTVTTFRSGKTVLTLP